MNYRKALLLGSTGCGKSSWLERFYTGQFRNDYITGPDTWRVNFNHTHFEISERREIPTDLGDYDIVFIMFDMTSPESYKIAKEYKEKIANKKIVLIGTKSDKAETINPKNIHLHRQGQKCFIYLISAKSCYNLDKPFLAVLELEKMIFSDRPC